MKWDALFHWNTLEYNIMQSSHFQTNTKLGIISYQAHRPQARIIYEEWWQMDDSNYCPSKAGGDEMIIALSGIGSFYFISSQNCNPEGN